MESNWEKNHHHHDTAPFLSLLSISPLKVVSSCWVFSLTRSSTKIIPFRLQNTGRRKSKCCERGWGWERIFLLIQFLTQPKMFISFDVAREEFSCTTCINSPLGATGSLSNVKSISIPLFVLSAKLLCTRNLKQDNCMKKLMFVTDRDCFFCLLLLVRCSAFSNVSEVLSVCYLFLKCVCEFHALFAGNRWVQDWSLPTDNVCKDTRMVAPQTPSSRSSR